MPLTTLVIVIENELGITRYMGEQLVEQLGSVSQYAGAGPDGSSDLENLAKPVARDAAAVTCLHEVQLVESKNFPVTSPLDGSAMNNISHVVIVCSAAEQSFARVYRTVASLRNGNADRGLIGRPDLVDRATIIIAGGDSPAEVAVRRALFEQFQDTGRMRLINYLEPAYGPESNPAIGGLAYPARSIGAVADSVIDHVVSNAPHVILQSRSHSPEVCDESVDSGGGVLEINEQGTQNVA